MQVRHGSDYMQEQVKTKIVIKKFLNWHEDFTTRMVAKPTICSTLDSMGRRPYPWWITSLIYDEIICLQNTLQECLQEKN